jgi:hypothetical protein
MVALENYHNIFGFLPYAENIIRRLMRIKETNNLLISSLIFEVLGKLFCVFEVFSSGAILVHSTDKL